MGESEIALHPIETRAEEASPGLRAMFRPEVLVDSSPKPEPLIELH